jgi:putative chitinase
MTADQGRHTVVSGETLSGIARRFGTSVQALAQLNNIRNVDRIRVGMVLRLPGKSVERLAAQPTYTVRGGDTLSEIAARFGTTVQRLASLNGIKNPNAVQVGLVLRLPLARPQHPSSPGAAPRDIDGPMEALRAGGGISGKQLLAIMPSLPPSKAAGHLPFLNPAMIEGGITSALRMAAFLAQLAHESVELRFFEEIASGAEYEGRTDLGNTRPGDGKRFKGRGPIQLTGRANYTAAAKALKLDLVENPQLAAMPEHGFRIAGWFWTTHDLNSLADQRRFDDITKRINGALNGKKSRDRYYARAKQVFGI